MRSPSVYKKLLTIAGAGTAGLMALTACGGSGGGGDTKEFSVLAQAENTTVQQGLKTLSTGACKSENADLPLKVETVPGTQQDQKIQLLAGQDALPVLFPAGQPGAIDQLFKAGQVQDLEKPFDDLGITDKVQPAALSSVKSIFNDRVDVVPFELNIEGIWYNKKILADNGIEVPTTWDELVAASKKLEAAGVQPLSASGDQGWPLTRLISGYIYRSVGPDAFEQVKDGKAKFTDADYVKGAQAVSDLGIAGYFGKGVGSVDYDTSINEFMNGKAAMLYMGSWVLGNFADKKLNKIGDANIGFFPFPTVEGGSGSIDQTPANVGVPYAVSSKLYNKKVGAWLKCIADNYASVALKENNSISGFVTSDPVDVGPLTTVVQDQIEKTQETVGWFEALLGPKASTASQTNAAPLVTGDLSAKDFMAKVQSANDSE